MRLMLAIWGSMVYASHAHAGADEQSIANLVEAHRQFAEARSSDFQKAMAPDYVHVTPEGTITTAWRVTPPSSRNVTIRVEKLHIAVFGDLAVASCLWHVNAGTSEHSPLVVQVFQRRDGWRAIATQIGGRDPWLGRITVERVSPANNPVDVEQTIRTAWSRLLRAMDLRTPGGGRAEDTDVVRTVIADDCQFVLFNGDLLTRDQRLAQGHPDTQQVTSAERQTTVQANTFHHVDEQLAVFGAAAVWVSRNPANGDQSFRVWQQRQSGWQIVAVHHGMSVRRSN
jgi:hypothetical protein